MTQTKCLPKLVIFGDPKKGPVAAAIDEFVTFVQGKAHIVASGYIEDCTAKALKNCNFAIVFGGDGSIISAARNLAKAKVPVIGVNLGKLGFLAEFSIDEIKEFFDKIVSEKTSVEKRIMLGCEVLSSFSESMQKDTDRFKEYKRSAKFSSIAVNDVFITAGPPFKMIELKIVVNGQSVASCVSDGLIISTPTGSTAYNLSAGGPILAGSMEAMVITPICPHSLSFRPLVIRADSIVEVVGVRLNEGSTVSIDGHVRSSLSVNDIIKVTRHSSDFLIVNNPLRTCWDTLAAKLGWAEKPKYKTDNVDS